MLYLLEDGRLVGDQYDSLMTWGPEGCACQPGIAARLAGEPARDLGVAPLH